jgi:hypothetical protein
MTARLWRTVDELARVWRASPYVQEYATRARGQLGIYAGRGADHIAAQPFFLHIYLPTVATYNEPAGPQGWPDKGVEIASGYIATIEWPRSRLPGYPFPGTPQLAPASHWTGFTVSMKLPWLAHTRSWQLQDQPEPPTMPYLPDRAAQAGVTRNLGDAVSISPAAAEVGHRWNALSTGDRSAMDTASAAMQEARYPQPDDVRGDEDFRQLGWQEHLLDEALQSLPEGARAFTSALEDADRMIQQAATLFSQLVTYGEIRRLTHIGYAGQLDGRDGWATVRSDSYVFDPIRNLEVIAFDHPYPRGVMLVEGITERLPIDPHPPSVIVNGRILADSEELAGSAVPIQPVYIAPDARQP